MSKTMRLNVEIVMQGVSTGGGPATNSSSLFSSHGLTSYKQRKILVGILENTKARSKLHWTMLQHTKVSKPDKLSTFSILPV
jgi:hypothetical protein